VNLSQIDFFFPAALFLQSTNHYHERMRVDGTLSIAAGTLVIAAGMLFREAGTLNFRFACFISEEYRRFAKYRLFTRITGTLIITL
jgi:hypothetical protein